MSLWNSFKKKIEDTWETADFWDKEENAQQVQARQPVVQPPVNNGGLRVTQNAPRTQDLYVAPPTQRSTVTVDNSYKPRTLTLPEPVQPKTAEDFVNQGLDSGKSWELIAKETGLDLNDIQAFSQATRPNYGVARMERPQQGNLNKFRDVLDANTEADKWRRQQGNDQVRPAEQKALTLVNPGNVVSNTVGAIPRMFNTAGNQIVEVGYTAQQQFATQELSAAQSNYNDAVKTGNPEYIAAASLRWDNAAKRVSDINQMIGYVKEGYSDGGGLFNAGTMYNEEDSYAGGFQGFKKIAGNTVEGMADAASLGLASVPKTLYKQGIKGVVKAAPTITKTAGVNFVGNAGNAFARDGDVTDALIAGTAGATLGTVADFGVRGIIDVGSSGKNKISTLLSKDTDTPVVTVANPITKEKTFYKPKDSAELQDLIKKIDGDADNGVPGTAGIADADGNVVHITAGGTKKLREGGYTEVKQAPETSRVRPQSSIDDLNTPVKQPDGSDMPKQVQTSTKQIGDLMDIGRYQKKVTENADDLLSKQYGVEASTVRRLRNGYGEESMRNILASTSDATNIRDMNGFVISEAKKRYGSPNVRIQKTADPMKTTVPSEVLEVQNAVKDMAEVDPGQAKLLNNSLPEEYQIKLEVKADAPDYNPSRQVAVVNGQRVDTTTGEVLPDNGKRYVELTNERLADSTIGDTPGTIKVGDDVVDTATGEVVTKPKTPEYEAPVENPTVKPSGESRLGNMVEDFYEARTGNTKIGFRDLENLGQKVSKQADDDFAAIGSDYIVVAEKIEAGRRAGAKTLEEAGLTAEEAMLYRKVVAEYNYIRRRASLGRKDVGEGDFGEMYVPNQKVGQYEGGNLLDGFRKNKPGNEFKRTNAIELEDLDFAPDVIGQYIARYGDTKAYKRQRIYNALKRTNPETDEELLNSGVQKIVDVQDRINKLKTKIGAFGFGSRKTLSDGKFVDSAAEISDVGKTLGKEQVKVTGNPSGFTNGDKLNSVMIGDKTAGDFLGLNQYRDAQSYGSKQVADAAGDNQTLARMVEQRLNSSYNLSDESIEYIVRGVSNMPENLAPEVLNARVVSSYKMAAKQQMLEQLQNVEITNPKMRRVVSNLTNQILREGSIEQAVSNKVVGSILQTTNAVFRKLNVSSAMNELGDLPKFLEYYGKDLSLVPDFKAIKEFGLGELDPALTPYIKQIEEGKSIKSVLKSINDSTNLYKFVETYKAGVIASSAKKFYTARGIGGDELVQRLLKDYRDIALPVDSFTKTFLDNAPLYTQYMTWGARNLQAQGRLLTGKLDGGKLEDMTRWERVARNAYTNLPASTAWWLTSNGLKGTAILTAFGLTDFTGLSEGDFSGISEEDKTWFDKQAEITNRSTVLSLINSVVQSYEKEQLKDKYADASYNRYADASFDQDILNLFTPSFIKNAKGAAEMNSQGYSENKAGRVQYEAPTDAWNTFKSYVFGKNQTENAREYSGRKNLQDRIAEGQNPFSAIKDMALEQVNAQDTDYNRPLTDEYSEAYVKLDEEARTAMLEGGRKYNDFLDNLRKEQPDKYDDYISSLDGNHVNPEYWKKITGNDPEDLTLFKTIGDRKKQQAKDLGTTYDPIYDLPDNQARSVLQQKSTATGEDIALRNALYKEQWFKDYQDRIKNYYNNKAETTDSDYEQTQRVVNWYNLNDQYNGLRTIKTDDGGEPAWASQYPTVYQQKVINDTYGFDSEESKNFFKNYGDAYQAEKEGYDAANLALINQMREIEGHPPMSAEQYAQVTAIENTDEEDSKSKYGNNGGSKTVSVNEGNYGQKKALELPSAKIKVAKVKINRSKKPSVVKMTRNKKYR